MLKCIQKYEDEFPDLANCTLIEGVTNPLCRAAYLGYKGIIAILLKHKANINIRSSDGRTPLMWTAFRNHVEVAEYLIDNGTDISLEDNDGWNALDLAIIRMNYHVALLLQRRGLVHRGKEMYEKNLWQRFDIDMFLEYLAEDKEEVDYKRFFDLIKSNTILLKSVNRGERRMAQQRLGCRCQRIMEELGTQVAKL